jgi:hypothetical protein
LVQTPDYESQLKERMVASEIYARQIQIQQAKVRQKKYKTNYTVKIKILPGRAPASLFLPTSFCMSI